MREGLQHIESTVNRFKSFHAGALQEQSSAQMEQYNTVLTKYKILEPKLRELDLYEAGHFNIFEIMKVNYYEVLVHTPILCNLLNPRGTHAQGDLFYRSFIETVFEGQDMKRLSLYDMSRVKVQDEMSTRYGQIDIFIQYKGADHSYIIIIENKIFAGDQDKQLTRYLDYATSLAGFDESNIRLLYLKPFEGNPAEISLDTISLNRLSASGIFKVISYKEQILPWLQGCFEEIKAPVVRYTVQQYIHTLKTICR